MLKKYPALSWGVIAGVVSAALAVWQSANAAGATNWWALTMGLIPIAANGLVHGGVVPVDKIKGAIAQFDTWTEVGKELARQVDVAVTEVPTNNP